MAPAATSPYKDVSVGRANHQAISWLAQLNVTNGGAKGNFSKSKSVTRGEFAAFLYRAAKPDHTAPATSPFSDLKAGGTNYDAITWLAAERISVGTKSGTYNQCAKITRGAMAAFLSKFDATQADK